MSRNFKDPTRRRMYEHYLTAEIARNILASDRAHYWKGRYGWTAQQANTSPHLMGYPAWAAGFDLYRKHGKPDFDVATSRGVLADVTPVAHRGAA